MKASQKRLLILGILVGLGSTAIAFSDVRFARRMATRDGRCDGAPCSVQVYQGPDQRLFVRIDRSAYDVDLAKHDAEQIRPSAIRPAPTGAIYRRGEIGGPPPDRLKYIPTPVVVDGKTITLHSAFDGQIAFTLEG